MILIADTFRPFVCGTINATGPFSKIHNEVVETILAYVGVDVSGPHAGV